MILIVIFKILVVMIVIFKITAVIDIIDQVSHLSYNMTVVVVILKIT